MEEETKKAVRESYTDPQKDLIRKFHSNEQLFTFVQKDLTEGISRFKKAKDSGYALDNNGWMHDLIVDHIAAPRQRGIELDREEFARQAEITYEALRIIREIFARYEIVASEDFSPKPEKKKPTGR